MVFRNMGVALLLLIILLPPALGASSIEFDEDTISVYDRAENTFFPGETMDDLDIDVDREEISLDIDGGRIEIIPRENWWGEANLTISNGTEELIIPIHVNQVNDSPEVLDLIIEGDPLALVNPLRAGINATDIDGDDLTTTWYLDGEEIGTGPEIQYYIYPGRRNLTVVVDDGNGGTVSTWAVLDPVSPPGWGEEPDNTRNRIIFWSIFGSGAMIFTVLTAWVFLSRGKDDEGRGG
jgi:hypothetical protein